MPHFKHKASWGFLLSYAFPFSIIRISSYVPVIFDNLAHWSLTCSFASHKGKWTFALVICFSYLKQWHTAHSISESMSAQWSLVFIIVSIPHGCSGLSTGNLILSVIITLLLLFPLAYHLLSDDHSRAGTQGENVFLLFSMISHS